MKEVKKDFELDIVNLLKRGLNPSKIAVHLNISLPNLSYYLSPLKRENIIKKVGYGVWEVIPSGEVKILSRNGITQVKDVRGHAFVWKIKANKRFNWTEILNTLKVPYEMKGFGKTPRIIIDGRKVWLGMNYITIYEPKWSSFFASNPIEAKKNAVLSLEMTLEAIKKELNIDFNYKFTCKRHHYGFIKNIEAREFISKGKKFLLRDESGYWFSIDNSQNKYEEAETIHEKTSDLDGLGYQRWMNEQKETKFEVTPKFILNGFNQLTNNLNFHAENMVSHVKAVQKLGEAVEELTKKIGELK